MERIFTAKDALEAAFVRGILRDACIDATVEGEFLREAIPLVGSALPQICVEEVDALRGRKVIDEYVAKRQGVGSAQEAKWRCACGEEHDVQFSACWKCGAVRPG